MLDLKSKLASAGLVSQEEIDRVEKEKAAAKAKAKARKQRPAKPGLDVAKLQGKPKGEVYDAVRRFVERARLDPAGGMPSAEAKAFHFPRPDGKIGRLMLEPAALEAVRAGKARIVAFMSNHGLAHAVVPSAGAQAIGKLMPDWLPDLSEPKS